MKAIFHTTMQDGAPVLPPMDELQYTDEQGALCGGYALTCEAPCDQPTVWVWASAATIAAMKADPTYEWVEDVPEEDL